MAATKKFQKSMSFRAGFPEQVFHSTCASKARVPREAQSTHNHNTHHVAMSSLPITSQAPTVHTTPIRENFFLPFPYSFLTHFFTIIDRQCKEFP
jgi:hypothetical protein